MIRGLRKRISLPWILVLPFVAQLLGVVGIVGYLSLRNGEMAVENLASRLMNEVCARTALQLKHYFAQPHLVNQINVNAIETGQLDLDDLEAVEATLFNRIQEFEDISGVLIGTAKRDVRIATRRSRLRILANDPSQPGQLLDYAATETGERLALLQTISKPDVRKMPWYREATQTKEPVWVSVFQTGDNQSLSLNASQMIHDPTTGELIGVASAGIVLSVIDAFLDEFRVSPNGVVFVMDRQGQLVGSSTQAPIYQRQMQSDKPVLVRIQALDSGNDLIRSTAALALPLLEAGGALPNSKPLNFEHEGERLFIEMAPFRDRYGLDLLIVVAVPERDFMAQIQANTRHTILLCLGATGIAIAMGLVTARWIAQPILQLSRASQKIAQGEFQPTLPAACITEVNVLVKAFNQMSQKVQDYSSSLEDKVRNRTAALEQEICDRKRIEVQLEQAKTLAESANHAKSDFLASMSHELRTPLNAILGFTQLMGYKKLVKEEHRDYLDIINQSGQHLLALINDVLDMSKIEANQVELDYTSVDISQLFKTLEDIFSLKVEGRHLALSSHIHPQVPTHLYTDEGKLRQILINLLSNALKFTQEGEISLAAQISSTAISAIDSVPSSVNVSRSSPTDQHIIFTVRDTGTGMDADEMSYIFDPFVQTRGGQRITGGTGLGLSISQQYARLLGGDLTVTSQPNEGSEFRLTLPAFTRSAPGRTPINWQPPFEPLEPQATPYRLLIAEDQYENSYLLQQCLQYSNLEIRHAINGQDCLNIWQTWSPHVILMDLAMPVMDGYETTQQIKATPQGQDTLIIAVTSYAFEENRRRAIDVGCDDFICKPVKIAELLTQLSAHLGITLEPNRLISCPINTPSTQSSGSTVPALLTAMPLDWIEQLQQVAYQCNDQQVMALLTQIPSTEAPLRQYLSVLAEAYHFHEIVAFTDSILAKASSSSQAS